MPRKSRKRKPKKDGLSPLRSHSPARRSTLGKIQSPNKRSKIHRLKNYVMSQTEYIMACKSFRETRKGIPLKYIILEWNNMDDDERMNYIR
jgi:hypothetical protein